MPYHAGLQVGRSEDIIRIGYVEAREALLRLYHDDMDTSLHVSGALGIADSIEKLEEELGHPVVSSNVATYWHTLRRLGLSDRLEGFGRFAQMAKRRRSVPFRYGLV